jgi:putative cell wall-binding protein
MLEKPVHRLLPRARVAPALSAVLLSAALTGAGVPAAHAAHAAATQETVQQFTDQGFPAAGTRVANEQTSPTEDKPQSKLWRAQGSWWALVRSASGPVTVHHLVDHAWVDTGTVVDSRATSTADVLSVGGTVYVASRTIDGAIQVSKLAYASGGYSVTSGPTQVATGGSESVTIARDSGGRLWLTYTQGSQVWVARTGTAGNSWTAPFLVPGADTSVGADDISAITAFDGHIGVLWSDQVDQAVRFAVHVDGDDDATWTTQTPLSGTRIADDHLNLKTLSATDGRVFAAVKTSLGDDPSDPRTSAGILVLTRSASGSWSSTPASTVADRLTRPQLVIDSSDSTMHLFMTTEAGGAVYEKTSPMSSPSFASGTGTPVVAVSGALINNATTSKDPVTSSTGIVVLASDEKNTLRYYHAEIGLGGGAAPLPSRLQGDDRYGTAAAISAAAFPDGAGDVVVASGESFPDALSAAPLAHALGGPVLLVRAGSVPAAVTAELSRLHATHVVVVGGTGAVSSTVEAALRSDVGNVERLQGDDRYGTAQAVAAAVRTAESSSGAAPEVVVASGEQFADALAGGAYAAAKGAPLLLTRAASVPAPTAAALGSLRPKAVTLLGGTGAVGTGVEGQLGTSTGAPVTRLQGSDRYGTAAAVSEHLAPTADVVLLASGASFPDAVAGAALGLPLELTGPACLPAATAASLGRLGEPALVALGGQGAVSDAAAGGRSC